jgi:CubicO group peptidase (beta-lactamase class C family)
LIAAVAACAGLALGAALPLGLAPSERAADPAATVIATYQARIPELMAEQDILGLAVALVDGDRVLWTQGFGHLDGDGSAPVDADTMFSVQSMSKLFTATAVMRAVQNGRLDLEEPITTYLPDFTVHSGFEDQPEQKITPRMLLSHTAGFTHEAPVGNNNELDPGTFDEHVRSIADTWLRFPVGTGYAYSNLGIDLAGYILERVYDKPFAAVMRDLVLEPIGMDDSSFDRTGIRETANRALGHTGPIPEVPVDIPMTAAGGLYTGAADLARFLRFQLNDGSIDGRQVLDPAMIEEMRTVPAPRAGASAGYALGVVRHRWVAGDNADLFDHGGGGFGFLSDLWWAPQLQLGIAVLTNSADHHLQGDLALSILHDLVQEPGSVYHDRLLALPAQTSASEPDGGYIAPAGLAQRIAELAMAPSGDEPVRWARYEGDYEVAAWGVIGPSGAPERFFVDSGVPYLEGHDRDDTLRLHRLTEIETGLFLADNGETLDLRGSVPTWRSFELVRVSGGPAAWQWAVLGFVAVVAACWLIAALVSTIRQRRRRPEPAEQRASGHPRWRALTAVAAALTATFALATIAVLAAIPGLVDSGFLGWLELPLPQRLMLHLPLAMTVAVGCLVVLTAFGWTSGRLARDVQLQYGALVVSGVVLAGQLAAWHLIGWGLT